MGVIIINCSILLYRLLIFVYLLPNTSFQFQSRQTRHQWDFFWHYVLLQYEDANCNRNCSHGTLTNDKKLPQKKKMYRQYYKYKIFSNVCFFSRELIRLAQKGQDPGFIITFLTTLNVMMSQPNQPISIGPITAHHQPSPSSS